MGGGFTSIFLRWMGKFADENNPLGHLLSLAGPERQRSLERSPGRRPGLVQVANQDAEQHISFLGLLRLGGRVPDSPLGISGCEHPLLLSPDSVGHQL